MKKADFEALPKPSRAGGAGNGAAPATTDKSNKHCFKFLQGKCELGKKCPYKHDEAAKAKAKGKAKPKPKPKTPAAAAAEKENE